MKPINVRHGAVLVSLLLWLFPVGASAATITPTSLSAFDVQAAINSSKSGDTVLLPAGNFTWATTVIVAKPITVQGAGIGVTVITSSGMDVFSLQATSKTALTRLTGITISGGTLARGVIVANYGITEYGLFRIDHCRILNGYLEGINVNDFMNGVIDHCQIEDCYLEIGMYPTGINEDHSWQLPLTVGSTNCTVIEDCVFLKTATGYHPFQGSFENGHGARLVFRYNQWTNYWSSSMQPLFDAHGNQGALDTTANTLTAAAIAGGGTRGTRQLEMYGNVFNGVGAGGAKVYYRGGVLITFSNQWLGAWDTGLKVDEEDSAVRFNLLSAYPGYDMHWMWTWNNTQNGAPLASLWYSGITGITSDTNDAIFLRSGTNVFWGVPPSASAPGFPDLFLNTPVSAPITSYTPLVYPHPLVSAGALTPTNPVISISPASLNFGPVPASTAATNTILVQNVGGGILGGTASIASPFSILSGSAYSLGPGQTLAVKVKYTPATGNDSGTLMLTGGGGAQVDVTGQIQ